MSGLAFETAYDSHAAFYQDVYGHAVREVRPAGRTGAMMMTTEQEAGDWSDAPVPDLLVTMLIRHNPGITIDVGAGRFRKATMVCRDFVVTPPHTPTSILIDGPHTVRFVAVPYAALRGLAGDESGLPVDGDFGVLHTSMQRDREAAGLIDRLWSEAQTGSPYGALWADGALLQLASCLLRLRDGRVQPTRGGLAPWQVRRVCDYLHSDLSADPGLAELASLVNLSTEHFCRAFKASTGLPPHAWLVARRVERARELLEFTSLPIEDVAAQVGYADPSYFARLFRRETGATPLAYRRDRQS